MLLWLSVGIINKRGYMEKEMPNVIFASIIDGYEEHGFGGCCWGTGEKYFSKHKEDYYGGIYYSENTTRDFKNLAAKIANGNLNQSAIIKEAKRLLNLAV